MRSMHWYSERRNVFKECPKLVVLWLVSRNNLGKEFHSLSWVQKTPEGHMSSDGTTARRADDQRRSVDDVSVPSRRLEHNRQLDTEAQYRWSCYEGFVDAVDWLFLKLIVKYTFVSTTNLNKLGWTKYGFLFMVCGVFNLTASAGIRPRQRCDHSLGQISQGRD